MPRSIWLSLYSWSVRANAAITAARPARPAGPLVWLQGQLEETAGALNELGRRIASEDGVAVLITGVGGPGGVAGVIFQPTPSEMPQDLRGFLDHWRPDACLISDGDVRPMLLTEVFARGVPVAIVNARAPRLPRWWMAWWPGLMRGLLGQVRQVLALDEAALRAFRRAGVAPERVTVTGRLQEAGLVLPAVEADRQALAASIGTRPVWFAASVPEAEEAAVLEAHLAAQRLAHRLLLILAPQGEAGGEAGGEALARRISEANGWEVASRSDAEDPDGETDIYIVNGTAEYGLWYRLAPISYLGGSLSPAGCVRNPFEVAALGSAILHGPMAGEFGARFDRLGAALASRPVAGAADLGEALGELLSPDRTARLAGAAWGVTSEGAEVTDRVMELVRRMIGESA